MTVNVVTLGCKVNWVESVGIIDALNSEAQLNLNASAGLEPADVYVLNTCSVTAEADRKSRQQIAKMQKLSPDCRIIVVGCSSQNCADKFNKQGVVAIGGTSDKTEFVLRSVREIQKMTESILSDRILYAQKDVNFDTKSTKTRTFIKIQDGCDRFCTYCIIPYLRGRNRSIDIETIKKACMSTSSKEIVLTGIDISAYGKDNGSSLTDLIVSLSDVRARKRLGSLECEIIDDKLLTAMERGEYCPHFHLSLQSGSETVLRSMNRHYDPEFFSEKLDLIRKHFPLAGVTTDVIVGFPTETDKLFEESCEFIRRCEFSDIHVFPYSSRRGTLASRKYMSLPKSVVAERTAELLDIKRELKQRFLLKNAGMIEPVYFEEKIGAFSEGYTPNYIKVYASTPCGDITNVKLTEPYKDGMLGIHVDVDAR